MPANHADRWDRPLQLFTAPPLGDGDSANDCSTSKEASSRPRLISGRGRFCTRVIQATAGRALVKTGAEGVYAASFPQLGLGAALKAEDGAGRASESAMAYLLARLDVLSEDETAALADLLDTPIVNRAGRTVGRIRATEGHVGG